MVQETLLLDFLTEVPIVDKNTIYFVKDVVKVGDQSLFVILTRVCWVWEKTGQQREDIGTIRSNGLREMPRFL